MVVEFSVANSPGGEAGVRVTVPVNPFTGDTVRTDVTKVPVATGRVEGLAANVKVETLIVRVTIWWSAPLVPSTSTEYDPGLVSGATEMVRSAAWEVVMLDVLSEGVSPGEPGRARRVTVPEKPLIPVTVIVEFALEPAWIVRDWGAAAMEKSGPRTATEIVAKCESKPDTPSTSTV